MNVADLDRFRDPALVRELIESIDALTQSETYIMEVCGTHTVSIARSGFRSVMPEGIHLISGPGCPVCVTANSDIDHIIALTHVPDLIMTTFGDMIRVPGSSSSLLARKAEGADVRIVYSPIDALNIAQQNPDRAVVFVGVGFETTTPLVGSAIKRAAALGLSNFSIAGAHKNVPRALDVLVNDPEVRIDALILPGHVSTIIGAKPYEFLAEKYGIPGVITGFEPVDVLQGIAMLMRQLVESRSEIEIAYARGVMPEGNPAALSIIDEVFTVCDADWRGLGVIEQSGYRIRDEFASFDAFKRFDVSVEKTVEPRGCRCGDVLRGALSPNACPLFGTGCTPEHPIGPCMVSSEGSCAAFYRYQVTD